MTDHEPSPKDPGPEYSAEEGFYAAAIPRIRNYMCSIIWWTAFTLTSPFW